MNVNPVNFCGIKIGHDMSVNIPKKKKEAKPTGFYQVANFLNDQDEFFDFRIRKPLNKSAIIDVYERDSDVKIGSKKVPLKAFAYDPSDVVGAVGKTIYGEKEFGRGYFKQLFKEADPSSDSSVVDNAIKCSDWE